MYNEIENMGEKELTREFQKEIILRQIEEIARQNNTEISRESARRVLNALIIFNRVDGLTYQWVEV